VRYKGNTWLCDLGDIPEGGSKSLGDDTTDSFFAVRQGNEVHVYQNRCPHAGMPLNWMPDRFLTRDKSRIICTAHGAQFDIATGNCLAGPCNGGGLTKIAVYIRDGALWRRDYPTTRK
jgi:nitrite reductase/ring-hydroxylating ferredoxin subunit